MADVARSLRPLSLSTPNKVQASPQPTWKTASVGAESSSWTRGEVRPLAGIVQRKASGSTANTPVAASSSGNPLPKTAQAHMEKSFGTSFSDVRIHQDSSADALGAEAYTHGSDIHFGQGRYAPDSPSGKELLGHELAHVVQQRRGEVETTNQARGVDLNEDPSLEQKADEAGRQAARGEPVSEYGKDGGNSATTSGTPVQLKRLRSELKGLGSGYAGQWHQGDDSFHVTVYGDEQQHAGSRGYKVLSDRWASEFHVTRKNPFGRRFYDIETGIAIGSSDQGKIDEDFDKLALSFMQTVVSKSKSYSDKEAELYDQEIQRKQQEESNTKQGKIREVVLKVAKEVFTPDTELKGSALWKALGKINFELRELKILSDVPKDLDVQLSEAVKQLQMEVEQQREKKKVEQEELKIQEQLKQQDQKSDEGKQDSQTKEDKLILPKKNPSSLSLSEVESEQPRAMSFLPNLTGTQLVIGVALIAILIKVFLY